MPVRLSGMHAVICLGSNKVLLVGGSVGGWDYYMASDKMFLGELIQNKKDGAQKIPSLKEKISSWSGIINKHLTKTITVKKTTSITIIPIGIAYSEVSPSFRGKFSLCFGLSLIHI